MLGYVKNSTQKINQDLNGPDLNEPVLMQIQNVF